MWWPFQWLIIYILGGFTCVPLLIVGIIAYVMTYGSVPVGDADLGKLDKQRLIEEDEKEKAKPAAQKTGQQGPTISGWLTVRRTFKRHPNASLFAPKAGSGLLGGAMTEKEGDDAASTNDGASVHSDSGSAPKVEPVKTTYWAKIQQTSREVYEARKARQSANPPKDFYYAVLKGSVLFLYEDEQQLECVAAIGMDKYEVKMCTKEGEFTGKDAEMFAKRNAITLKLAAGERKGLPALVKGMQDGDGQAPRPDSVEQQAVAAANAASKIERERTRANEKLSRDEGRDVEELPWFFFAKSNTKMEDWYLALTQVSHLKPHVENVFAKSDLQTLVDVIHTDPDPDHMRWFNAMLGRVFFGVYRTEALEQLIISKIMKKIAKVPQPSWLGPIVVREVNVGTSAPIFSKPMLKHLTADGTASFDVHVAYKSRPAQPNSDVRITIATSAHLTFPKVTVDLVLSVVLKSIEGDMTFQIKAPPSNRVWYGFTSKPKMEFEIVPIISDRKFAIDWILTQVGKKVEDLIAESIVLPNMDDIAFFDTSAQRIRGAIFSECGKKVAEPSGTAALATEKGSEPSTQPGLDVSTSKEDPSSATAETLNVRKSRPTKSQTADTNELSSLVGEVTLPRTETAPVELESLGSRRSSVIEATKRTLAADSDVDSKRLSTSSLEKVRASQETPRPGVQSVPQRDGTTEPSKQDGSTTAFQSTLNQNLVKPKPSIASFTPSLGTGHARSASPSDTASVMSAPVGDEDTPSSSTTSLLASFRTRDKKALQSQLNVTKDAVKKWGIGFAAKHRPRDSSPLPAHEEKPAALYRPAEEDGPGPADMAMSPTKAKSLKERLDAAAALTNAAPVPIPATGANRERTSSVGSSSSYNRNLSSSARSNGSTSGSGWNVASSQPTTGVNKDKVSGSPSKLSTPTFGQPPSTASSLDSSIIATVSRQPSAGRSMVVPRVVKRPGELTAFGSERGEELKRVASPEAEEVLKESQEEDSEKSLKLPALPLRRSVESDRGNMTNGAGALPKLLDQPPSLPSRNDRGENDEHLGAFAETSVDKSVEGNGATSVKSSSLPVELNNGVHERERTDTTLVDQLPQPDAKSELTRNESAAEGELRKVVAHAQDGAEERRQQDTGLLD